VYKRQPDFESAVELLAKAKPGQTVVVPAGTYTQRTKLKLIGNGEAGKPVTLIAENGDVRIEGRSGFDVVDSNWLIVDGFTLAHQGQTTNVWESNNVRLTRIKFALLPNPAIKEKQHVVTPVLRFRSGTGHRIDHSNFGPHPGGLGVTLLVENEVQTIRIDGNYFHDRERDGRNGAETLRLGSGGGSVISAVVESNLFERCHREAELVSIKSDGAVIRNNTFRDNRGQLVVRNGRDIVIIGNYFIGEDVTVASGGIRVHGQNICVGQNYFANLATPALQSFPGSFALAAGTDKEKTAQPKGGYPQSSAVVFAGNIAVSYTHLTLPTILRV